ncbi:MAG TPA: DUF3662 and FHA domain-containing protein [Gaiellaceae bacterium]|jgi:hypothetical protein|nr:DUF3662 and FHA domain-containing protein [Gaiellaceae bacterium]
MTVLRTIESKLEALFEGIFGRAFRANVQPVELARKLVKEMDEHRNVSVSRVYVPNEYTIYLSPDDRRQFADYEESLREELQEYLASHARREGYVLLSPPRVKLETDADLELGLFGIATRLAHSARPKRPQPPPTELAPGATMIYDPGSAPREPVEVATITFNGRAFPLDDVRTVIGRSKDADIQVPDPNVSRRHAEVRHEGADYLLVDLDSTNGIEVDGRRVRRLELENGTRFTLGSTELVFSRELRE